MTAAAVLSFFRSVWRNARDAERQIDRLNRIAPMPKPKTATDATREQLEAALDRSVKLQSHYAGLLNQYDGGQRMTFDGADAWIARLSELGKLKKRR